MSSVNVIKAFWVIDFAGTVLGVILNILLFVIIFRTSQGKIQQYSYIFLITAAGGVVQSVVEMVTAHQLILKKGVLFVLPMGIERHFPNMLVCFFFLHVWLAMLNIFVVAAQHKFRYAIIKSTATTGGLLRDLFIVLVASLIISVPAGYGIVQTSTRNLATEYLSMIDDGNDAKQLIMYTADVRRDWGTMVFVYGGMIFGTATVWLFAYYMYKSFSAVQGSRDATVSNRTIAMQREFAKSLVVQTINTAIFVMTPLFLICVALALRWDYPLVGAGIMSPLNWLPAVNAIIIISMIKTYRNYIIKLFGKKQILDASSTPIKTLSTFTTIPSASKCPA
ncbi:hypothetical protein M3Y96_00606000 [Aphelenchoides besseyi]|nr:hypothetical protein M3Y96_00606000 [Aphelenchoides besseyi]